MMTIFFSFFKFCSFSWQNTAKDYYSSASLAVLNELLNFNPSTLLSSIFLVVLSF